MADDISYAVSYTARSAPAGASVRAGYGVVHDTSGAYMVEANTANLAAVGETRAEAIALQAASGGPFLVQSTGYIPPGIASIGAGNAGDFVETDATGALVRNTVQTATSVGVANKFGGVTLSPRGLGAGNATLIQGVAVATPTTRGTEAGYDGVSGAISWQWPHAVNVLRFGADRTGATPSDTALANAIAALGQGAGGVLGGTIEFPPGKYVFRQPVNLGDFSVPGGGVTGIKLSGAGGAQSYPNSLTVLEFQIDDTRGTGASISAVSAGFATLVSTPGKFTAADVDCSIRLHGWPTQANNGKYIVTAVSGDGSQATLYNPAAVVESGGKFCVGHVGLNIRTGDVWLDNLRLQVGVGHKMTALVDWTESGKAGHSPLTRMIVSHCFMGAADFSTARTVYNIRIGRAVATGAAVIPFQPANLDYLKLIHSQFWQADEACIGIVQASAQSRSNEAYSCDFIASPNGVYAQNGTQWATYAGSWGGNFAGVKLAECFMVLGGSGPASDIHGIQSEGSMGCLFRTSSIHVNVWGGHMTLSTANMRADQIIGQIGNSGAAANWNGMNFVTSDPLYLSTYVTAATASFETTVNYNGCTLPSSAKTYEPHYLPATKNGPYVFHDGDVLTFVVDGVTKTCTLHTTGSTGVPKDLDGNRRWRFGVSGSEILEAQGWEIANLIEEQIPGLGAFAYGDMTGLFIFSKSGASGSVQATYPLGAGDPNHVLEWTAGLFVNSAPTQCSVDTDLLVGPGPNNSSAIVGCTYYDPTTKVRRPGSNKLVRTGSATNGGRTVLSGVAGIGAGLVARNNISGSLTFAAGSASATVTFGTAEKDTNYTITYGCTSSPALLGGAYPSTTTKSTTGFTAQLPSAPVGSPANFDWHLIG